MQKRGVFLALVAVSILFIISLIFINNDPTITGMQTGGLGCCVYADRCEASDPASCLGDFFNQPCSEITRCQLGCCVCVNATGHAVASFSDISLSQCSVQDPGVCYGIVDIASASFTGGVAAENCTTASYTPASVSGYISDKSTKYGIQDVTVKATPSNLEAKTNAFGEYTLNNIPPGTIGLIATHPLYYSNTSSLILAPGESKANYNINLTKMPLATGSISGSITATGQGASPDGVTILLEPTYDSVKTDANGAYSFQNLKLNTYTITASKAGYSQNSTTAMIDSQSKEITVDLSIRKLILGTLSGTVKNSAGAPLSNARVYVDGSLKATTNQAGAYTASDVEVGPRQLYAALEGYSKTYSELNIVQGANTQNFVLSEVSPACSFPNKPASQSITLSHIPGVKGVRVSWASACSQLAGYQLNRTGASPKTRYFPVLNNQQILSYIDSEVDWSKTYSYSITSVYDDTEIRYSTPRASQPITLGDHDCEGKYSAALSKFNEFCKSAYLRKTCNASNKMVSAPERGTDPRVPPDCSALNSQGANYVCSGPDSSGLTYCKNLDACDVLPQSATPFGIYFNKETCYGSQISPNYCYFDYSSKVVDTCNPCSQSMKCFDYQSSSACSDDNCQVSGSQECGWYSTYPELGKGICYEQGYNGTAYCSRCDSNNDLFANSGCTQELCSKLGNCYSNSDQSRCTGCVDCESLTTEQQCTGGTQFRINGCSQSYTPSNDACGLGRCKWGGITCYKDGNDKDGADCLGAQDDCKRDFTSPITEPAPDAVKVTSAAGITLISSSDAKALAYCIDTANQCCPSTVKDYTDQTQKGKITLSPEDLLLSNPDMFDGQYYIRFYSTDINNNQELLKSASFIADLKPPRIIIIPAITKGGCGIPSSLKFNISLDDYAECTDKLQQVRGPSCSQNCPSWSTLANSKGILWSTTYETYDGDYVYSVTCKDNAGNIATEEKQIELDACWLINIVDPADAIKDTSPLFDITTTNPASCKLYFGDIYQKDFTTEDGLSHTSNLQTPLEINKTYQSFKAQCTNLRNTSQIDTEGFSFTTDFAPPATEFSFSRQGMGLKTNGSDWHIWLNAPGEANITFTCHDTYGSMLHEFGCGGFKFCSTAQTSQDCTPSSSTTKSIRYNSNITTKMCYSSDDLGGNEEEVKCGIIHMNEGNGINLVNPPYGVSNINLFDVEIGTIVKSLLCKFQAFGFSNTFESQNNPANFFEPRSAPPAQNHIIRSFADATPTYDMYVKCKDMNGFINEDQPANFMLEYDPTPPVIQDAHAEPDPVIQGNYVTLVVQTDDKAICKFSNWTTDYSSMAGKFDGWQEFGKLEFKDRVEPEFKYRNTVTLSLQPVMELVTQTYNVACQNKAGNVSETKQLSFVVDYSQSGMIMNTAPSGSINYKDITLAVNTSKNANCQYQDAGYLYSFTQTGGVYHTAQRAGLQEARYSYPIRCNFFSPAVSRTSSVDFIVDLTAPVILTIDDGNVSCGTSKTLQIDVQDISPVYFNYSLYDKLTNNQTAAWAFTTASNPTITLPSGLQENRSYYFKIMPIDAAGNKGAEKQSDGFFVRNPRSDDCIKDTTPPKVQIRQNTTSDGLKISIVCTDDTECKDLLYNKVPPESGCNATVRYDNPLLITQKSRICWRASDPAGNIAQGSQLIDLKDSDGDGVPDDKDKCPNTRSGDKVDQDGCSADQRMSDRDKDGVPDQIDECPETPLEEVESIDEKGCSPSERDTDKDKVVDSKDKCSGTPLGEAVDADGCSDSQKFSCGDGISDDWRKGFFGYAKCDGNGAASADPADSGMTNLEKYMYYRQTGRLIDPTKSDTDGDGWSDKAEISANTNPIDPDSMPKSRLLPWILIIIGLILILVGAIYLAYMEYFSEAVKKQIPPQRPPQPPPGQYAYSRQAALEQQRRRLLELQRRQQEIFAKRREEKEKKRETFFGRFGGEKEKAPAEVKPAMVGKVLGEKPAELKKPVRKQQPKTEFEKLAALRRDYFAQRPEEQPPEPKKKVPLEDIFIKLGRLIKGHEQLPDIKLPRKISEEDRLKARSAFSELQGMTKQKNIPVERRYEMRKEITEKSKEVDVDELRKEIPLEKEGSKEVKARISSRKPSSDNPAAHIPVKEEGNTKDAFKKLGNLARKNKIKDSKAIKKSAKKKKQ